MSEASLLLQDANNRQTLRRRHADVDISIQSTECRDEISIEQLKESRAYTVWCSYDDVRVDSVFRIK